MSSLPWRKAWKPRGAFAAVSPGCRAWYHVLCAELADDDGTVTLVDDGRNLRSLTGELGRRLGATAGERRVLEGYLRTLVELDLLVVDEDGKRLVVVHWEDEQEASSKTSKAPKKGRSKASKTPDAQVPITHEPQTSSERTSNEPKTNLERTRNEIEDKPSESLTPAREMRRDETRGEESVSRASARPPADSASWVTEAEDEPTAASRWSVAFVRAVHRATGHEPHMAHRHGAILDLLRRVGVAELVRELEGFEGWLATTRKRPSDPWLRFCDHVGRWNEPKGSNPPRVDWASQAASAAADERDLLGEETFS